MRANRCVVLLAVAAVGAALAAGPATAATAAGGGRLASAPVGAPAAAAAYTPPLTYTTTVKSGVPLLGGTTDIGNTCPAAGGVPSEDPTPCTTRVEFPFPVTFYGVTYTSALADAAGNIQFTGDATRTYGGCFPDPATGAALAVFSTDWMTSSLDPSHGIFTAVHGTAPNRTFVVEWRVAYEPTSSYDNYAEWDFEAQFQEGSSTLKAVFGPSFSNKTYDRGMTFVHEVPAKWYGTTGVQDGLGRATQGCPSVTGTGSTPAAGVAVSYTPSETPPATVEQDSPAVKYTGTWTGGKCGTTTCSPDNKQMNSSAAGSRVKFTYTGKRADWVASRGPNGGKVGVYVDGVLKTTVNLYSPVIVDGMTVYTGPVKASGSHTVELRRVSGRINVDAFRVYK